MKFFSELVSCLGGATTATSAVEATTMPPQAVVPRGRLRRVKSSIKQWKPALSGISEDGVVLEEDRNSELLLVRSEKDQSAKAKSATKPRPPPFNPDNYRKSSYRMAFPAFSPIPFLF